MMSFPFTKEQRARAKKNNVPLVGFTIDARHCRPPGNKIDVTSGDDRASVAKVKALFLEWLTIAYGTKS
jgi:hypothetical protein